MVSQTTVNGPRFSAPAPERPLTSVEEVRNHFSELAYDVITLGELQVKLLACDAKETAKLAIEELVILAATTAIILGSVPVLLMGSAELLVQLAGWNRAGSYLLVGGVSFLLAIGLTLFAIRKLKTTGAALARSQSELQSNLAFIKSLFRKPDMGSSTSTPV